MERKDFIRSTGALAATSLFAGRIWGQDHSPTGVRELDLRQTEIDAVKPDLFRNYCQAGLEPPKDRLSEIAEGYPAIGRLEKAFSKVFDEVRRTEVTDLNRPAIWYLYNMGVVVKTPKLAFAIDLHHRRAEEFAPILDFACITHNHVDHYTERFKVAMDRGQRKCVINNFFDNYGARNRGQGGFTRAKSKTFDFGDAKVITGLCDHNNYLIDYTTTFEIHIGDFTLFHSGDCYSHGKFDLQRSPDLWILHPYCGMDPVAASVEKVHPKKAVIAHLQELHHPKGRYRWTYRDGLAAKAKLVAAGFDALMPMWGERMV